jgi:inner membrane protein
MMAGSHVVVGLAVWTWVAPHVGLPPFDPVALASAAAGSLLPDIDHPQSFVGRRAWVISRPLAAMIGHRGLTHSILAVIVCCLLLRWYGVSRAAVTPLAVGYLSHLGADFLTPNGLRLAWPLQRRYAIPLCKTGSLGEPLIVTGLVIWVGATVLHLHTGFGL